MCAECTPQAQSPWLLFMGLPKSQKQQICLLSLDLPESHDFTTLLKIGSIFELQNAFY